MNLIFSIMGLVGGLLCCTGDILFDLKGKGNKKLGTSKNIDSNWSEMSEWRFGASTVIVVLADKTRITHIEDGSLVIGNLMNAAHSLGIGSCWIHRAKEEFETEKGKKLLKEWNIPDNYVGIGHCILGYTEGPLSEAKPRKEDYVTIIK